MGHGARPNAGEGVGGPGSMEPTLSMLHVKEIVSAKGIWEEGVELGEGGGELGLLEKNQGRVSRDEFRENVVAFCSFSLATNIPKNKIKSSTYRKTKYFHYY